MILDPISSCVGPKPIFFPKFPSKKPQSLKPSHQVLSEVFLSARSMYRESLRLKPRFSCLNIAIGTQWGCDHMPSVFSGWQSLLHHLLFSQIDAKPTRLFLQVRCPFFFRQLQLFCNSYQTSFKLLILIILLKTAPSLLITSMPFFNLASGKALDNIFLSTRLLLIFTPTLAMSHFLCYFFLSDFLIEYFTWNSIIVAIPVGRLSS